MLDYYYNILDKKRFEELFGHLETGKNATRERIRFLCLTSHFHHWIRKMLKHIGPLFQVIQERVLSRLWSTPLKMD
jgi:hypothetical protein